MKKWHKTSFLILQIGWLPFMFLAAWGQYQPITARVAIALFGFFVCFISSMGLYQFFSDKKLWLSFEKLENKEKEYISLVNEAFEVRDTLTRKIVRENKNNDFILSALNAYWNDAHAELQRKDLGDIERKNYEFQLNESKRIMKELE